MSDNSYEDVYDHYLVKFKKLFGKLDCGETVQYRGQLIQKLDYEDFVDKWKEFKGLDTYLFNVMSKGATLNDEIYRQYQSLSAQVLEKPKDFMTL
jgi:hypothetical protein